MSISTKTRNNIRTIGVKSKGQNLVGIIERINL